jgi:hypothetical protein
MATLGAAVQPVKDIAIGRSILIGSGPNIYKRGVSMKGILEFNLDEPFERNAHKRCTMATEAYINLSNIMEYLRRDDIVIPEHVRDDIRELIFSRGVSLDDLD